MNFLRNLVIWETTILQWLIFKANKKNKKTQIIAIISPFCNFLNCNQTTTTIIIVNTF